MKTQANLDMTRVDRLGQALARRLNDHATELPHDITERLRAARMQALAQRKREPILNTVPQLVMAGANGTPPLDEGLNLWSRLASALPVMALLFGLASIHVFQNEHRTNEIASLDAELLTDDLPPDAYTDPGFLIFLKSNPSHSKVSD
ncbi:DUF3619 family protein [Limnohabitans sp. 103DPR2]|uniref:DUF3619 family protein n=1 Tax=Limnohabitans sp. 103DPR2 TaxID=1678129 RepID=UPI0007060BB7|nr:DUF3619 family protein [Limnohabitans sp. 103DPR2]ALK91961.1 hypothetical protein L103DPR2_01560 [Limnohabitans sp. 103DPR2]